MKWNWSIFLTLGIFCSAAAQNLELGEEKWHGAQIKTRKNGTAVYSFNKRDSIVFQTKDLEGEFSFALWMKPDPEALKGTPILTRIGFHTQLGIFKDGRFYFHIWTQSRKPLYLFGPRIRAGEWQHVTALFSRKQGGMSLYLNGEKVASRIVRDSPLELRSRFVVGRVPGEKQGYSGLLAKIMIFENALSPDKIRALADTKPEDETEPSAH